MESKGWLYYTKTGGGHNPGAGMLMEMHRMLEPSVVHVQELKQEKGEERHACDPFERDEEDGL